MSCEECKWRALAQRRPDSFLARLWRWHTGWCPGWRRYQAQLTAQGQGQEQTRTEDQGKGA